jgi:hypothetical protein
VAGSPDCSNGQLGYSAGPGFDLVTGWGSIDISNFVGAFNYPTVTTLSVSAVQAVENAPLTFSASVRALNGEMVTGSVELVNGSNDLLAFNSPLDSSGNAQIQYSFFPGTYTITARFLGSAGNPGIFGRSISAPVNVTVLPRPPQAPLLTSPANQNVNVSVSAVLSWSEAEDTAVYDVYFGTTPSPPFWGTVTATECFPGGLVPPTTYYWKVVARNASGMAASPIALFTTGSQTIYQITVIGGAARTAGFAGDGGPAVDAEMSPIDVAVDGETLNHDSPEFVRAVA